MRTITVTADHIKRGCVGNVSYCPVALAVAEAHPGFTVTAFNLAVCLYRDGELVVDYTLPDEARLFIDAFDHRKPVTPFTFTLLTQEAA